MISVEEYLSTMYHPDCDFLDGEVVERNWGEYSHSRMQTLACGCLFNLEKLCGVKFLLELRIQVRPGRYRIADICAISSDAPGEQVPTYPPFLCVEILSIQDTMRGMLGRIDDYLAMGVPHVWVIDPETRRGYHYTSDGMREVKDGVLRVPGSPIEVPISALFD